MQLTSQSSMLDLGAAAYGSNRQATGTITRCALSDWVLNLAFVLNLQMLT